MPQAAAQLRIDGPEQLAVAEHQHPAPVTVHCEVGVRLPPYPRGKRNTRSAAQKWLEVMAAALFAMPPATKQAARPSPSAMVEQAPYKPR